MKTQQATTGGRQGNTNNKTTTTCQEQNNKLRRLDFEKIGTTGNLLLLVSTIVVTYCQVLVGSGSSLTSNLSILDESYFDSHWLQYGFCTTTKNKSSLSSSSSPYIIVVIDDGGRERCLGGCPRGPHAHGDSAAAHGSLP